MSDLISRCKLFNRLATIPAPPEANDFKAEVYKVIQAMETEPPKVVAQITLDADLVTEEVMRRIKEEYEIDLNRGEWKIEEYKNVWGKGYLLTCSKCGETFTVTENALPYEHFCRNCGANMTGGE